MSEEQRSFWQRLFGRGGGSSLSQRQQKVLGYMIGRLNKDVRRNCSAQELEQIVSNQLLEEPPQGELRRILHKQNMQDANAQPLDQRHLAHHGRQTNLWVVVRPYS